MLDIELKMNYQFKEKNLLKIALTHKSYQFENGNECLDNNEKLEYLGDAVLDLALAELLLKRFKSDHEGSLSKKRASLVNEAILSKIALDLNLNQLVRLGKGEVQSGGATRSRLLASTLEAVFGAIHLDGGYISVYQCIEALFSNLIEKISTEIDYQSDYKTRLQELVQRAKLPTPLYHVVEDVGPSHNKSFIIEVEIQNLPRIQGIGKSKKVAEQNAAQLALETYLNLFTFQNSRGET